MTFAIVLSGFVIAGMCAGVRLLQGPTLADRVVALDVALISLMGAVAAAAAQTGESTYLSLLIVISIVGFTATVAASKFVESKPPADGEED